jgi:hypothetical protein
LATSNGLAKQIEKVPVIKAARIFLVKGAFWPGYNSPVTKSLTCSYIPNLIEQLTNYLWRPGVKPLKRFTGPSSVPIFKIV